LPVLALAFALALGFAGPRAALLALAVPVAVLLVLKPQVTLALFLLAGTYKAELVESFHIPVDPTVFLAGLLLLGIVVGGFSRGFVTVLPDRRTLAGFGLLAGVMLLSYFVCQPGDYGRDKLLRFALLTGLATFAPFALVRTRAGLRWFAGTVVVLGMLMPLAGTVTGEGLRAFGATHIATGRAVGFGLLAALYLLLDRPRTAAVRVALLVAAGILGLGLLYSGSRGSMVALVASLAGFGLVSFGLKKGRRWALTGLAAVAVLLAVVSVAVPAATELMNHRLAQVLTDTQTVGAALGRLQRAEDAIGLFRSSPVLGVGIGGFDMARGFGDAARGDYAHNILLEVACELGLAGLAALFVLIWTGLSSSVGAMRRSHGRQEFALATMLFLTLAYFLVNAMFSGDLNDNRLLFAGIGFSAALAPRNQGSGTRGPEHDPEEKPRMDTDEH